MGYVYIYAIYYLIVTKKHGRIQVTVCASHGVGASMVKNQPVESEQRGLVVFAKFYEKNMKRYVQNTC